MSKVAEAAYDAALFDGPDNRDEVIAQVAERLSVLGFDQESTELAHLAALLRGLIDQPKCNWCGALVPWGKSYHALGGTFCSRQHMDEALAPDDPPEQEAECLPPPNE